jgi:hypothetical protein
MGGPVSDKGAHRALNRQMGGPVSDKGAHRAPTRHRNRAGQGWVWTTSIT